LQPNGSVGHYVYKRYSDQSYVYSILIIVVNLLLRSFKIIHLSRVMESTGKRIIAVLHTAFSGAVIEMLCIAAFFEIAVFLCSMALLHDKPFSSLLVLIHRSLLFGDGDALTDLNLVTPCEDTGHCAKAEEEGDWAVITLMMCATVIFNIFILNLIIAVYGNEYDRNFLTAPLRFVHQRAALNCKYYLMLNWVSHGKKRYSCWKEKTLGSECSKWSCSHKIWKCTLKRCQCLQYIGVPLLLIGIGTPWYSLLLAKAHKGDLKIGKHEHWLCVICLTVGQLILYIWSRESNDVEVDAEKGREKYLWYVYPLTYSEQYKGDKLAQEMDLDHLVKNNGLEDMVSDVTKVIDGNKDIRTIQKRVSELSEEVSKVVQELGLNQK